MKFRPPRTEASVRYLVMSGISFTLNIGTTATLHEGFGVAPEIAFAIALVLVFTINFIGLRWWVFAGTDRSLGSQFLGFGVSSLCFRSLEYGGYWVLLRVLAVPYLVAAVATIGVSFVVKYVVYDSWLFSRRSG
jgi:putative flippase GtrA